MKFIDELDVERINQTLNFETTDCKITGGCDIFTTKAVASDKKLYKTIDHHLETILQENESYNAALQQQQQLELESNASPSPLIQPRRDSTSFWEQKRRMSITDPINSISQHFSKNNSGNNSDSGSNANFSTASYANNSENTNNGNVISHESSVFIKSTKLNDQNLKELVEPGYASSSSIDSSSKYSTHEKIRRSSSSSSVLSTKSEQKSRRISLNDANTTLTIGPFGPITEPASRRTFAYLIAILNASYPDHDFSNLEPTDFIRSSLKSFISKFENSFYSLGKQPEEWIWEVINSHMTMSDCVVYQYSPSKSFLEDEPGYLWSLMGFLFNKKRKRVAFIYLISSRLKSMSNEISDDFTFSTNPNKKEIIDYDEQQFEGEYDLANDEHAVIDESDEDF